jgi:acyl carrier protein
VKVLPRKSTIDNELLTYRYDAVIFVGEKGEVYNINNIISNFKNDLTVQDVRTILIKTNPEHLAILYIPNAKLQRIIPLVASTHSSSMFDSTIEKITKINNQSYVEDQISLDNIIQLSEELNYKTEISWIGSDRRGSYNVILFKPHLETKQFSLKINDTLDYNEQNVYSNNPLKIEYQNNLIIQLKAFLSERLLDAMIPSKIYCLYKIPLLPNGKTDRRFLLSLVNDDTQKRSVYIPPRNDIERYLVRLVEDILNISSISITDNFFDLGGHSLLATRLITKIRADYQITISIKVVFEYPVIEHLANQIQNHLTFNKIKVLPLKRVFQRDRFFPLSYSQRRLWFLHYFESVKATYNRPIILKMRGNLNVMALKSSIQRIIDRHEVLRTSFPKVKGEPLQQIHKDFVLEIPLIDLSYQETDQEIQKYVQKAQKHVFELEKSPPIIANILKLDKENYFLIITVHHIISDGWSINIFVNELSKIYSSIIYKKNLKLPTLKIQYGDYAAWQKKWFSSGILDKQILYWKNQLSDLPLLTQLPLNYPRPEKQSYHGRTKTFKLSKLVYEKLVRICDQKGVTLFMLLLTIFKLLIHKQIHQTDLVVGTPLANRVRPEIENLIGFFVNTLVIRTTVTPDMTFNKYLMSVKQVLLEAYDNQDLPFEKIVEIVNPQRNLSFSPLFQIMFILQNTSMSEISLPGITTTAAELDFTVANFDMTFQVYERPDGLDCSLEYNSDIYSSERMSDFINRFKILTNIILTGTEEKISNISTLSGDEKTKILQVWSKQQFNYQEYSFLGKDSIVLLDEDYNL